MGRTALLGTSGDSWRSYLRNRLDQVDLLRLDPSDSAFGLPGTLSLVRNDKVVWEKFYGSIDPLRSPHVLVDAAYQGIRQAKSECVVLLPPYRTMPLIRQLFPILLGAIQASEVLVSSRFPVEQLVFSTEPERVELDKSLPVAVLLAQRKARWMDLRDRCYEHSVDLRQTRVEGIRLGSGEQVSAFDRNKLGLHRCYAEVVGTTLLVVTGESFSEETISQAMDFTHTNRVLFADPREYFGAMVAVSRASGEDFGFGFIRSIDFTQLRAQIDCTASPPVPIPILKVGSIVIDADCNELAEFKPWSI